MKIKLLKDDYIFSETGTHICDSDGFALKATEDSEFEIGDEHFERVSNLVVADRLSRGLDADGKRIPKPKPQEPELFESEPTQE